MGIVQIVQINFLLPRTEFIYKTTRRLSINKMVLTWGHDGLEPIIAQPKAFRFRIDEIIDA